MKYRLIEEVTFPNHMLQAEEVIPAGTIINLEPVEESDHSRGFKECFECAKKIGTPTLCNQCIWVRNNYKPVEEEKDKLGNDFCDSIYCYDKNEDIAVCPDDVVKWWLSKIDSILKARDEELIEKIEKLENFECLDLYSQPDDDLVFKKDVINLIKNNEK